MVIAAENGGEATNYLYGLERIAALNGKNKTEYAYDGRGSVAAELRYTDAWYTLGGALSKADVTSKSYTPFGEQIGEALSGFGYNGEYYNANTGMVYLRARFYEPEMNRFSQKDIVRGGITVPNSLNRYTYVQNDPLNLVDPSGESLKSAWNSAKTAVKNAWTAAKTAVSNAANSVKNWATNTWNKLTNKSSAPAVTPPAPAQQRNTSSSGVQTQKSGSNKNAGKPNYSTASFGEISVDSYSGSNPSIYPPTPSKGQIPQVEYHDTYNQCTVRTNSDEKNNYIIFTSGMGADFTKQAIYQGNLLTNAGKNVTYMEVNTKQGFEDAWNKLNGEINSVIIISHSNERAIILEDGSTTEGLSIDGENSNYEPVLINIKKLAPKDIETLEIISCNAGHLSAAQSEYGNVAQAFTKIEGIEKVIAYDGNVGFGDNSSIWSKLLSALGRNLYPRQSSSQESFTGFVEKYENGNLRDPLGKIIYYPDGSYEVKGW